MFLVAIADSLLGAIGAFLTGCGGFLLGWAALRKSKQEQRWHDEDRVERLEKEAE